MELLNRWGRPVVVGLFVALAVVAVFHMQLSTANYDPQYMRVLVERTVRFGGSYYENGIHNKGPLEPAVYELAARIGGRAGFWFVIAVMTLVTSLVIGAAAAIVTERAGGSRIAAASVGALAVTHLTLSSSDYSGVLYSRNITVGLLSTAVVAGAWDPAWVTERRRIGAVLVGGVAIGLTVQTLLSACFTAVPVLSWLMWTRRHARLWTCPAWAALPAAAAAGFLAAPLYYRVFGPWDAFVDGWWTYARWMNTATGRSLGGQFGLGVDQFVDYYGDRPELVVVLVAFVVEAAVRWRRLDGSGRAMRSMVAAWWLAAWIELVLSQRYSSHYYSILAVPMVMMIAVLAGAVTRHLRLDEIGSPLLAGLPLAVTILTIEAGGTQGFREGLREASGFERVDDFEAHRDQLIDGRTHMLRATMDLVSEPADPLLMWTSYPWPYLNYRRVAATRYIWKNFLLGEIYLARSGPQYVLPGTWETFAADVVRTDPAAFVVDAINPVVPGTPFEALVAERFTTMFGDDVTTLALRNDLARWLRQAPVGGQPDGDIDLDPEQPAMLAEHGCVRIDADLAGGGPYPPPVAFRFGESSARPAITFVRTGADAAVSTSSGAATAPFTAAVQAAAGSHLTLVVGARSAVLLVDGAIAGAAAIDREQPVMLEAAGLGGRLTDVIRSHPPGWSGC